MSCYVCNCEDEYAVELCSGECDLCEFENENYWGKEDNDETL